MLRHEAHLDQELLKAKVVQCCCLRLFDLLRRGFLGLLTGFLCWWGIHEGKYTFILLEELLKHILVRNFGQLLQIQVGFLRLGVNFFLFRNLSLLKQVVFDFTLAFGRGHLNRALV